MVENLPEQKISAQNAREGLELKSSFVQGKCTNEKLQSVGISCEGGAYGKSRQLRTPQLLSKPSKTDVPIPRDDFALYRGVREYHVSQCDVYSITSPKSKKRLNVFKWAAEVPECCSTVHALLCEV
ncbi:hypothetical protein AAVH_20739 [Aphelenchoides avenae]|nr:hypothetical protein AAVH_20739 [Aphelenchus avenae]